MVWHPETPSPEFALPRAADELHAALLVCILSRWMVVYKWVAVRQSPSLEAWEALILFGISRNKSTPRYCIRSLQYFLLLPEHLAHITLLSETRVASPCRGQSSAVSHVEIPFSAHAPYGIRGRIISCV